jgi:hypothetical protein
VFTSLLRVLLDKNEVITYAKKYYQSHKKKNDNMIMRIDWQDTKMKIYPPD